MRVARTLSFAAALLVAPLVVAVACSHADEHPAASTGDACSGTDGRVLLAGEFTDEACRAFVEAESSIASDDKAPTWSSPKDGAKLPAATPATFSWTKSPTALLERLLHALDPLKRAQAHGDTTGDGYVLIVKDGSGKELFRVMTTDTSWTPDPATWKRMTDAKALSLTLVWAKFTQNAIAVGTKPSAAKVIAVTVG